MRKNLKELSGAVGVLDFETDPFEYGNIPKPFASCVYFGANDFSLSWEPAIITKTLRAIERLPECSLYAHNGGKFDFHFLIEYCKPQNIEIRNGRIVSMRLGKATLIDSWPLMPFALNQYQKTEIDYSKFKKNRRAKFRKEIENYLIDDCRFLLELLLGFKKVVGPKNTIGSAAFYQMRELEYDIQNMNETHDAMFRPFYFGGRVEAIERGIHRGPLLYLDINSAYPFAMMQQHSHGGEFIHSNKLPPRAKLGPCFIRCIADSKGALPLRGEKLEFPHVRETEFFATGWEILAGLQTNTLTIREILDAYEPESFITFKQYVQQFFALRDQAKKAGDKIGRLAYKYLLNSGYGKFAQNPREFKKYQLARFGRNVPGFEWESDFGGISLWSRPAYAGYGFYDVATGASITGFVRAYLWRAICASRGVIYCDTDSLLCRSSHVITGEKLGQWKVEGIVKRAAIAGKKLYGIEWQKPIEGEKYRVASKGARLTFPEILALCQGETVHWKNAAPTFSITGPHFIERDIVAT